MPKRPGVDRPHPQGPAPDAALPNATDRGYDRQWKKRRLAFLADIPLCVMCLAAEKIVEATVADHVIPHKGDPDLFWNGELQALCERCHNSKSAKE